jgi:hypothetical protein
MTAPPTVRLVAALDTLRQVGLRVGRAGTLFIRAGMVDPRRQPLATNLRQAAAVELVVATDQLVELCTDLRLLATVLAPSLDNEAPRER